MTPFYYREVQEVVTSVAVAGPLGIGGEWVKTAPPYDSGNGIKTVSYKSVDGGATLSVQSIAGSDEVVVTKTENGVTTTNSYTKLQMDDAGNISFETATIQDARADGSIVTQLYVKNELRAWLIEDENGVVIMRSEGTHDSDGNLKEGNLEARQPSYEISQPSYDIPAPEEKPIPLFYSGFQVNFTVSGGKVASASTTTSINNKQNLNTNSGDDLYVLANGIGNDSGSLFKTPKYLENLEVDLISRSQVTSHTLTDNDIIKVPLYPGYTSYPIVNAGIDVLKVLIEGQSTFDFLQTAWTKLVLDVNYLWNKARNGRPVIAMGYSGGFAPLIEALGDKNIPIAGMIGLGAATFQLATDLGQSIVQVIDNINSLSVDGVVDLLRGISFDSKIIADIIEAIQAKLVKPAFDFLIKGMQKLGSNNWIDVAFPNLNGTGTEYVVNIIGSEDLLLRAGAAGWRNKLGGVGVLNVEIMGATHFDYMRREGNDPSSCASKSSLADKEACHWNVSVANFVTDLMVQGETKEKVISYLNNYAQLDSRGIYVIKLLGWEKHV